MTGFAWAKDPMFPRMSAVDSSVPVTAMYGGNSWMTRISQEDFEGVRPADAVYTQVKVINLTMHEV